MKGIKNIDLINRDESCISDKKMKCWNNETNISYQRYLQLNMKINTKLKNLDYILIMTR